MKKILYLLVFCLLTAGLASAQRVTIPLDGEWQVEDSVAPDKPPSSFGHKAQVPGLANLAVPGFPDVDMYLSRELAFNLAHFQPIAPDDPRLRPGPRQSRNYFWYRKTFGAPARRQVAVLRINKAQFGTAVWLNGRKIGEHAGCYTAGYFDITEAMNWTGQNRLLVRIGAHPGVLPENIPTGTDFEKNRWTPGIYDSAAVLLTDNPVIASVQVAPRIASSEIVVQTRLENRSRASGRFELSLRVSTWKEPREVSRPAPLAVDLAAGEEKVVTQTIPIPGAQLWTPETPFLYTLETATGGDSASTRFGMREFRFDTATRRAYLNGRVYFLRGSNITLHRFFEDPQAGALPWTDAWVRRLLVDIPKRMNWNSLRFCIGPVPDKWLDLADETGLLIQNEYFIWTGHPSWTAAYQPPSWDANELVREYTEWMRDNWNHPSVVIWDATNESLDPVFADKVIPAVRGLDLSNRPWENSYNGPPGPDDPVEEHPYLQQPGGTLSGKPFAMADLEVMTAYAESHVVPSGHAKINNEYGWLWLLRDGTPTSITKSIYDRLLGPDASGRDRLALNAYLLAGETEFFRAHRGYAGVLHFVYLTSGRAGAYTCDHFQDIPSLALDPGFADYVREAFKPLGVYINFWQPNLKPRSDRRFPVMMVNDDYEAAQGKLILSLESEAGGELARSEVPFSIPGLGQQTYEIPLRIPRGEGRCLLKAAAYAAGSSEPTLSRRKVALVD